MLCEKCKKKKATLYYHENINGQRHAFHLCGDCAALLENTGELEEFSTLLPTLRSSLPFFDEDASGQIFAATMQVPSSETSATVCPRCGIKSEDIVATGSVGCAACYATFASQLFPAVKSFHGQHRHKGRIPRIQRQRKERSARIAKLKAQLKTAVQGEAFEEAVLLRDELRRLEQEQSLPPHPPKED